MKSLLLAGLAATGSGTQTKSWDKQLASTQQGGRGVEDTIATDLRFRLAQICPSEQALHMRSIQQFGNIEATFKTAIETASLQTVACIIRNELEKSETDLTEEERRAHHHVEGLNVQLDDAGLTPLMHAIKSYDPSQSVDARRAMILWLIAAGADVNRHTGADHTATALDMAQEGNPLRMGVTAALLFAAGAGQLDGTGRSTDLREPTKVLSMADARIKHLSSTEPDLEGLLLEQAEQALSNAFIVRKPNADVMKHYLLASLRHRCPDADAERADVRSGVVDFGQELLREVQLGRLDGFSCRLLPILKEPRLLNARLRAGAVPDKDAHPAFANEKTVENHSALSLAVAGLAAAKGPERQTSPFQAMVALLLAARASSDSRLLTSEDTPRHAFRVAMTSELPITAAMLYGAGASFQTHARGAGAHAGADSFTLNEASKAELLTAAQDRMLVIRNTDPGLERLLLINGQSELFAESSRQKYLVKTKKAAPMKESSAENE